tara:strand:+ start:186 stop:365 length:180 start_codon:yes stop_codon:yes gene_type:complete
MSCWSFGVQEFGPARGTLLRLAEATKVTAGDIVFADGYYSSVDGCAEMRRKGFGFTKGM